MIKKLDDLLVVLGSDPSPEEIRSNDEGYFFIPISIVQSKLDTVFGYWNCTFDKPIIEGKFICGQGSLIVHFPDPISNTIDNVVHKSGTAAVARTGDLRLDYPKLETMCILNAAKKLGRYFGRDLNRDKEDILPSVQVDKNEDDVKEEYEKIKEQVEDSQSREGALAIIENSGFKWHIALKAIANNKPSVFTQ